MTTLRRAMHRVGTRPTFVKATSILQELSKFPEFDFPRESGVGGN